jgi:hypothetical protein
MSKQSWTRWMIVLPLAVAMPLAAQTFSAGDDGWTTPSGGQTQVDLSQITNLSGALGSAISGSSLINLQGSPLDTTHLGTIDTILGRGAIASGSGTLTLVALNLVSSSNFQTVDGRTWSLQVCLSDDGQAAGSISLTQANGDGGTFSSSFTVVPKLVFTNVNETSQVVTIDCGAPGACNTMTMTASNAGWVQTGGPGNFNPATYGIDPIPSGSDTVANCGGTHSVSLVPENGFYPGWTASSGSGGSSVTPLPTTFAAVSGGFTPSPVPHNHASSAAWPHVNPPQDCLRVNSPIPIQGGVNSVKPELSMFSCYAYTYGKVGE